MLDPVARLRNRGVYQSNGVRIFQDYIVVSYSPSNGDRHFSGFRDSCASKALSEVEHKPRATLILRAEPVHSGVLPHSGCYQLC
jgi:hypothetical protein